MLRIIFEFFIYVFAIYGFIIFIVDLADSIYRRARSRDTEVKLLLVVKDQEENIEGIIRNVFLGDFPGKAMAGGRLIVVDLGSVDNTVHILSRLKQYYENMEIITKDEKEKVTSLFSH